MAKRATRRTLPKKRSPAPGVVEEEEEEAAAAVAGDDPASSSSPPPSSSPPLTKKSKAELRRESLHRAKEWATDRKRKKDVVVDHPDPDLDLEEEEDDEGGGGEDDEGREEEEEEAKAREEGDAADEKLPPVVVPTVAAATSRRTAGRRAGGGTREDADVGNVGPSPSPDDGGSSVASRRSSRRRRATTAETTAKAPAAPARRSRRKAASPRAAAVAETAPPSAAADGTPEIEVGATAAAEVEEERPEVEEVEAAAAEEAEESPPPPPAPRTRRSGRRKSPAAKAPPAPEVVEEPDLKRESPTRAAAASSSPPAKAPETIKVEEVVAPVRSARRSRRKAASSSSSSPPAAAKISEIGAEEGTEAHEPKRAEEEQEAAVEVEVKLEAEAEAKEGGEIVAKEEDVFEAEEPKGGTGDEKGGLVESEAVEEETAVKSEEREELATTVKEETDVEEENEAGIESVRVKIKAEEFKIEAREEEDQEASKLEVKDEPKILTKEESKEGQDEFPADEEEPPATTAIASLVDLLPVFLHVLFVLWTSAFAVMMSFGFDWWVSSQSSPVGAARPGPDDGEDPPSQRARCAALALHLATIVVFSVALGPESRVGWILAGTAAASASFSARLAAGDHVGVDVDVVPVPLLPIYSRSGIDANVPDVLTALCLVGTAVATLAAALPGRARPVPTPGRTRAVAVADGAGREAAVPRARSSHETQAETFRGEGEEVAPPPATASAPLAGPRSLLGHRVAVVGRDDDDAVQLGTVRDYVPENRGWLVRYDDEALGEDVMDGPRLGSAFELHSRRLSDALEAMRRAGEL